MLRGKKKGAGDFVMFMIIAATIILILIVAGWIGKGIQLVKQTTRLQGTVDVYLSLDDKGTEFSFLTGEKDGSSYMEILGLVASGAKVEGNLKTQLDSIETSLQSIAGNSDKDNYYLSVIDSSGNVVYEKKTGNPPVYVESGSEDIKLGWPVEIVDLKNKEIKDGYGWRDEHPVTGEKNVFHGGVDIGGDVGDPVIYSGDIEGSVVRVEFDEYLGNFVVIQYISPKTGAIYHIFYGHLNKAHVSVGETVKNGDKIAEVGATGRISGPHLHLEIRKQDFTPKEDSLNPCLYVDLSVSENPEDCMKLCIFYEDPSICEKVTTVISGSITEIVKNRFDIPLLGGNKGNVELVLW